MNKVFFLHVWNLLFMYSWCSFSNIFPLFTLPWWSRNFWALFVLIDKFMKLFSLPIFKLMKWWEKFESEVCLKLLKLMLFDFDGELSKLIKFFFKSFNKYILISNNFLNFSFFHIFENWQQLSRQQNYFGVQPFWCSDFCSFWNYRDFSLDSPIHLRMPWMYVWALCLHFLVVSL